METCDELRSFTRLRSFWDTCFASTDLGMYPSQMVAKKWSPESMRHEKRGPSLSTNTRGECSEIQDILLGTPSSPCSRSLEATSHVVRKTVVENASYLRVFSWISSLAHCQPHAGTPIPGIPSQAVRTLSKGQGQGRLKKNHGLTPKMVSLVQKLSRMGTFK